MKTELAIRLQSILKNMPQKAFDKIWSKVIKDKKDSPSFKDVKESIKATKTNNETK